MIDVFFGGLRMFMIPTSRIDPMTMIPKTALYYNAYAVLRTCKNEHVQGDIMMGKDHKHIYIHDGERFNKYEISNVEIDGWYYVEKYDVWRSPKKVS